MIRKIRFTRIISMADQVAAQLQGLHFSTFQPPEVHWQPAVNVYAFDDCIEICVDLAGVRKDEIQVDVEPRRLVIHGNRSSPDSGCGRPPCGRVLVMEIPDGRFVRVVEMPWEVDTQRVEARQDNGWLWITLPKVQGRMPL